ncbi:hypothetical protein Poly51_40150 [Rubripirellula tenax]|uniref:Uncharacterized protein n=1 Tax=Rubripirellula tenax TaxID=2528015 RepID=A0A5C6ENU2_9BACT|nr:hypothetical protein [Rubripirellula tenax]TWU50722.1 hypothetical protein Poly51_40150 [Rubripirellula tenax]
MDDSTPIPGFSEISDWPTPPALPLSLQSHGFYRDPNPYCTHYVDIVDADGNVFPFFFERFLGRLCYGATNETSDDAAFVTSGSALADDVFAVMTAALENDDLDDADRLRDVMDRGLHWSQR